jgi:hypothetical protein
MPSKKAPARRKPAKNKKLSVVSNHSLKVTTQSNRVTIPKGLKHVLINPADPMGLTIQHFLKVLFGPEPLLYVQQKQLETDLQNLGLIPKPAPKIAAGPPSPIDTTWSFISALEYHGYEEQNRIIATVLKSILTRREKQIKTKDSEIRYNTANLTRQQQSLDELNRIILGDHEVAAYDLLSASPAGSNQADSIKGRE